MANFLSRANSPCVAAVWWIPFYLLIVTSFKNVNTFENRPFALPSSLEFDNYKTAWQGATVTLGRGLINSLIITVGSVVIVLIVSSVSAYAIGRRSGKAGKALDMLFLLGIILPFQLGIAPMFVALRQLGLAGTYVGMILLYAALLMPLGVFLYVGFIQERAPRRYEEAAAVDGASRARIFVRVVFPLLLPVTGTVAVLAGMFVWNDFFTQLVMLGGSSKETLPVAIYSFVGEFTTQYSVVFASYWCQSFRCWGFSYSLSVHSSVASRAESGGKRR